jgi:hypothetical protein
MGKKKKFLDVDISQEDIERINILKDRLGKNLENEEMLESLINDFKTFSTPLQFRFIEELKDIKSAKLAIFLRRIIAESNDKLIKKSAKRILHILKTKGIEVKEEETIIIPIFTPTENYEEKGLTSSIDTSGDRVLYLIKPSIKTIYILSFLLNDREGLKRFYEIETTVKGLKKFEEMIKEGPKMTEIDVDHCKYLIKEAYDINISLSKSLPDKFLEFKHIIDLDKGVKKAASENLEIDPSLWKNSYELFDIDEMETWFLTPEEIKPYIERYNEADKSRIIISPYQKEERLQSIIKEAADEIFDSKEIVSLYRRRLEEMGYIFIKSGRNKDGELSYAAAHRLETDIKGSEHPFLFELTNRSIKASIGLKKEEKKSRIIISPEDINASSLKNPFDSLK